MSYLTETTLKSFSQSPEGLAIKSRFLKFSEAQARISIFLSHSHKDKELVEGLIETLAHYSEISIYVDWQDSTMPRVTSRETAQKIKERIANLDYFLILGTKNAMESRWVPWEIGIADTTKSADKIAIIPVINLNEKFQGNEYLQLYKRIEIAQSQTLGVFAPNADKGSTLKSWLSQA